MVQLALALARRVVHREVTLDPELPPRMARVALERLGDDDAGDHPAATPRTTRSSAQRRRRAGAAQPSRSSPIRRSARGGCLVESDFGIVDADLDAQFDEIARALLGDEHDRARVRADCERCRASRSTRYLAAARRAPIPRRSSGRVVRIGRPAGRVARPARAASASCASCSRRAAPPLPLEVVGFRDGRLLTRAARRHRRHPARRPHRRARRQRASVPVGPALLGRVVDGARPAARRPRADPRRRATAPLYPPPLNPLARDPIVDAARHRRARHRRAADLRPRPAHRPVRRQRRRQEHAARHDGARHRGRRRRASRWSASAAAKCAASSSTTSAPRA